MRPVISTEISNFTLASLPDQITYSDADLRAQLGEDSLDTLDSLRGHVIDGFRFTQQDLVNQFADSGDPQAVADFNETLDIVRAGIVFNESDITDRMTGAQLTQFDEFRGWISLGWTFRWVIFLPALIVLLAVAFIGGRGWAGRAKWAGAPVAIVAVLFFGSIQIGWASTVSLRTIDIPVDTLSAENRAEFPILTALVDGGEFQNMAERVGSSWISGLAMSAVPWAVAGLVLFAIGLLYPKYREMLPKSMGGPGGDGGPRSVSHDGPSPEAYEEFESEDEPVAPGPPRQPGDPHDSEAA